MANTTFTAKNSFGEGLIMDFAPDNTQANCLTSALNATLLTFNGNEMSLQNDMGNGRVETARLPEGYIPVGTCEFGDIIYIVSYNPLTNKSQIGCFPSPERNISTEEQGLPNQSISCKDFQEVDSEGNPTGNIKNMNKKLILTNSISPSDKFIIYNKNSFVGREQTDDKIPPLSGWGANSIDEFPRLVKVHVVSYEDDGKIKYLDSTVKWYGDYFIANQKTDVENIPDIDSYRNILSSGYSIFQSKVSGRLGLYFELESIKGFSCTHDLVKQKPEQETDPVTYNVNLNYSWDTDNMYVNPSYIVVTKSELINNPDDKVTTTIVLNKSLEIKNSYKLGESTYTEYEQLKNIYNNDNIQVEIPGGSESIPTYMQISIPNIINKKEYKNNNIINTYYTGKQEINLYENDIVNILKSSVYRNLGRISVPKNALIDTKYNYEITPAMPYGLLPQYKQEGTIDFGKIGTGYTNLTEWRYYNTENLSTFTLGFDIYPEEHHYVKQIGLSFYDDEGYKGTYLISGKSSYSGKFTEILPLNNSVPSYKLHGYYNNDIFLSSEKTNDVFVKLTYNNFTIPDDVKKYITTETETETTYITLFDYNRIKPEKDTVSWENAIDRDDSGNITEYYAQALIESNKLYLVKITVEYTNELDPENTSNYKYFHRWFWSNNMFNDNYYDTMDFSVLQPTLQFDCNAQYVNINETLTSNSTEDKSKVVVEQKYDIDLTTSVQVGFQNNYNTFNLNTSILVANEPNDIKVKVNIPNRSIIKYDGSFDYSSFNGSKYVGNDLIPEKNEIYNDGDTNKDQLKITFKEATDEAPTIGIQKNEISDEISSEYISSDEDVRNNDGGWSVKCSLKDLVYLYNYTEGAANEDSKSLLLNVSLENFYRYYNHYNVDSRNLPVIKPVIYDQNDLEKYNFFHKDGHFYINNLCTIAVQSQDSKSNSRIRLFNFKQDETTPYAVESKTYTFKRPNDGGFGFNHTNFVVQDQKLATDIQDGFYLWAVDSREQNPWTDTFSEMLILDESEDIEYIKNTKIDEKKLYPTHPNLDRIVTYPLSFDLDHQKTDWRVHYPYDYIKKLKYKQGIQGYDKDLYIYPDKKSLFYKSDQENTAYCTMYGLALVHNKEWLTLNNVFNFEYDWTNDSFRPNQNIKYRGSIYGVENDINKCIIDIGDNFQLLNEGDYKAAYISFDGNTMEIADKYIELNNNIIKFNSNVILPIQDNNSNIVPQLINQYSVGENKYEDIMKFELGVKYRQDKSENKDSDLELTNKWSNIPITFKLNGVEYYDTADLEIVNGDKTKKYIYTRKETNVKYEITYDISDGITESYGIILPTDLIITKTDGKDPTISTSNNDSYTLYVNFNNSGQQSTQFTITNLPKNEKSYPLCPGDLLVSLLNQVYIKTTVEAEYNSKYVQDITYTKYNTLYTKDIFYEVWLNNENELINREYINIQGNTYSTYLSNIKSKAGYTISDDETNLQIKIGKCIKTVPVTFNISNPELPKLENPDSYTCLYYNSDGTITPSKDELEYDIMYYLNGNRLSPITMTDFNFYSNSEVEKQDNGSIFIKPDKNSLQFQVNRIQNAFKIDQGYFTLNKDFAVGNTFQIALDCYDNKWNGIRDIPKKASLFKGTEILI